VAVHAEDEERLKERQHIAKEAAHPRAHPIWRDEQAALLATQRIVRLGTEAGRPVLAATFSGDGAPVTNAGLCRCLLRFPLLTWKIIAGIHFEALRLWLKGAPFFRSPPPPRRASFGDTEAREADA
jgi:DUF1365 family protein